MVGKIRPFFPMIGKIFSPVFQRLEKIFAPFPGNKTNNKTPGGQNRRTIPTIPDNCLRRQLGQPGTTPSRCRADNSARRQVANGIEGGISATKDTKGTKRDWKTSERNPLVREVRLSSRAPTAGAREGGVRGIPECRSAASDGWEAGGMSTLKTRKTASRTGMRLG